MKTTRSSFRAFKLSCLRAFVLSYFLLSVNHIFAQDVITFTWQAGYIPKDFHIQVTYNKTFTVDWGDGSNIETFTGQNGDYLNITHIYNKANSFLVTLTADTEVCQFLSFVCEYEQIDTLNVSGCTNLYALYCNSNQLNSLDVSGCTGLQYLFCYDNQLTSIDVSSNKALIELGCNNNLLKNLDMSNLTMLKVLRIKGNQITSINLSKTLETLDCSVNQLKILDVKNNKALKSLQCSNNQLANLDISNNIVLQELFCYDNQLIRLDVSNCKRLKYLFCHNNQLTNLDLSNATVLEELYCSSNQLTSLNARGCAKLVYLSCCNNKLSILDISGCKKLEYLYGYNNQLTYLDVSSCKVINDLWIYNNRFSLSDLYAVSENINAVDSKLLGNQTLLPQRVAVGYPLFSDQSVFKGIFTNYTVTKNGSPAPENNYTVTDGKITFNTLGIYTVTMKNDAIVSNTFYPAEVTVDLMVVDDASIEENGVSTISVYPNPTTGVLNLIQERITNYELGINNEQLTINNIEIFDISGKKCQMPNLISQTSNHLITSSSNHLINISHLPAGIYFLKIQTEKDNIIRKIVKQ